MADEMDVQDEISRLSKIATQQKYEDLSAAIDTLRQVKTLMTSGSGYTVKQWLRLPKFLNEAGRFSEAIVELDDLRQLTPSARDYLTAKANGGHMNLSKETMRMLMHADLIEIYKEMSTAAAWSGSEDHSEEYARKSEYHAVQWEALNKIHS